MAATDQSIAQLTARLATLVRDPTNSTWLVSEFTEAMTEAVDNDQWLLIKSRDTSLTSIAQQVEYTFPSGFVSLDELALDFYDDGYGLPLDRTSWESDDGAFYF